MMTRGLTSKWDPAIKRDIEKLALCMQSYAEYLTEQNKQQNVRQGLNRPSRQISSSTWVSDHPQQNEDLDVDDRYSILEETMASVAEYEPVFFDEEVHLNRPFKHKMEKVRFLDQLKLSVSVDLLRYDPGGACGVTVFIWRVPKERSTSEMMTSSTRIVKSLETRLPEFLTRRMRKDFSNMYGNVSGQTIPPHVLNAIYADIGLDASGEQNPAISLRLEKAILGDDPDLLVDTRHINKGRPADTFVVFFDQLAKEVENLKAADERRHGIQHMSEYISVPDLIKAVASKCPPDTLIPSESTVLFAFAPKNSHSKVAKLYKQRVDLKFQLQTRQLRVSHIDEHYCAAILKYMKCFAVMYRDKCTFLCVDDKAKVDFGEPGSAISSGVRGRRSIVPTTSSLSALDHDVNSKGSLTPSVTLNVTIPESATETFYRGEVTVTLKDSIFQASSPFRHTVETLNILRRSPHDVRPILLIYSDGGPDHRVTYGSVKIALIALFKQLNLDLLVAARTAPGHSWANPAERVMLVINLAYQNCALMRDECSSEIEQVIRSLNSMEDIRKKSLTAHTLKEEWMRSTAKTKKSLEERVKRLSLKDIPFKSGEPANEADVENLEKGIIASLDRNIEQKKYQQKDLAQKTEYQTFLKHHCLERHYSFQIQKCKDPTCCRPLRSETDIQWLPDPETDPDNKGHFKAFETLIGRETSEKDRPTSQQQTVATVAQEQQGCKNAVLVAQNVRSFVSCYECSKPRCLYAKGKLTTREHRSLKRLLERHDYSCGSIITPDGDSLQGKVFVRLQLACSTPIEFAYYSVGIDRIDLCCLCGQEGASRDTELMNQYRVVLPVCNECIAKGKMPQKSKSKKSDTVVQTLQCLHKHLPVEELKQLSYAVNVKDICFTSVALCIYVYNIIVILVSHVISLYLCLGPFLVVACALTNATFTVHVIETICRPPGIHE